MKKIVGAGGVISRLSAQLVDREHGLAPLRHAAYLQSPKGITYRERKFRNRIAPILIGKVRYRVDVNLWLYEFACADVQLHTHGAMYLKVIGAREELTLGEDGTRLLGYIKGKFRPANSSLQHRDHALVSRGRLKDRVKIIECGS